VRQHFWFLDIAVGGLHLHTLCKLALAALLPALMVPGLVYSGASITAVDALVMLQVMGGGAGEAGGGVCCAKLCGMLFV
jgi:hypothetical protein